MYGSLSVYNKVITAFLCQHGCIVLWVFTSKSLLPFCLSMDVSCSEFSAKSLLPFCVSMDVLCSGYLHPSHYCLSVSAWMHRALSSQQSHYYFSMSTRMYCALCSQPSHNCLSVSAWMYCALCSQPSHICLSVSAWVHRVLCSQPSHYCLLCQHGYILLWVFTTKSLLPFCVTMNVLCSECSQHSYYFLSVSASIYLALGVHSIAITAFLCQHGYILLWVFTALPLLPFCVCVDISCSGCSQHSHDCLSVSAWMYCALCSQPSHYCLSVSAWVYRVMCS
ncbi:hypothetical protein DPMN_025289 [Dreissena polymorpha]|uniref:Uncharacterized protein n=1 Tax=Dreissena polymorpha TaxID=45954 RepID=A0A9D4LRB1_DREPO|nr:hypothetical protein DPMN_025289 [Dreissena polymorpha]